MQIMAEALGLMLPGTALMPATAPVPRRPVQFGKNPQNKRSPNYA